MADHASSDELAQLALQAPVDASVAAHVEACDECRRDLSLLTSLLEADGPDGPDRPGQSEPQPETSESPQAMADGADGPEIRDETVAQAPPDTVRAVPTASSGGHPRRNAAVAIVLLLFVAAIIIAVLGLR